MKGGTIKRNDCNQLNVYFLREYCIEWGSIFFIPFLVHSQLSSSFDGFDLVNVLLFPIRQCLKPMKLRYFHTESIEIISQQQEAHMCHTRIC